MSVKTKNTIGKNKYGNPITDWGEIPVIFDVAFAVRLLRQDYHVIIKKCQRGEIPAFKIGREWRIVKEALLQYIKENGNDAMKKI